MLGGEATLRRSHPAGFTVGSGAALPRDNSSPRMRTKPGEAYVHWSVRTTSIQRPGLRVRVSRRRGSPRGARARHFLRDRSELGAEVRTGDRTAATAAPSPAERSMALGRDGCSDRRQADVPLACPVGLAPDAILAGATPAVAPLRQQTRTIPIVFVHVVDPVGLGFVQSLARPGGNITGFSSYDAELAEKWLQLLKEIAPGVTRVAVIFNPDTAPFAPLYNRAIEAAAPSFGVMVTLAPVRDDAGIEEAIAIQARGPGGGLIDLPESFSFTHRDAIIAPAARHSLPLIGSDPRADALMSYWFDPVEVHAQAASYIDRILKGASPADLPVQQPTKYSLTSTSRLRRSSASLSHPTFSSWPTR
jgi:putative ABC transport system substrate-binding protein